MEAPETFYSQVENVCRELYIQSLKEIPPDIVEAIRQAAQRDTKEVGRRIFSHYLKSIDLGRSQNMIVCQDTGIPIYWVEIGGNLRMDGARLTQAIIKGTERATREHPLRSSIVSPITRENRQTSTGERIPIIRSEEHTSEIQSRQYLVCRLLLEKKTQHKAGTHARARGIIRLGRTCTRGRP